MSTEKAETEVHHDISNDNRASHDIQYPVVAEGTGKTLDEAHGAKAKEVHNVSPDDCVCLARSHLAATNPP